MVMDKVVMLKIITPTTEQINEAARDLERELYGNSLNAASALYFSEELKRRVMEMVQINIENEK